MDELRAARWAHLGRDALEIDAATFAERLARTSRPIKAALLDQHVIAGLGNIYADEALHRARIDPRTRSARLASHAALPLWIAMRAVLDQAIAAGGSTFRDYADAHGRPGAFQRLHMVYGRGGEPCMRCGRRLRAAQIAQRTTVWCPGCQGTNRLRPQDFHTSGENGDAPRAAVICGPGTADTAASPVSRILPINSLSSSPLKALSRCG
jgi:formamidopyrimidine-DNA glycosylase